MSCTNNVSRPPWAYTELICLLSGYNKLGPKWAKILNDYFDYDTFRTRQSLCKKFIRICDQNDWCTPPTDKDIQQEVNKYKKSIRYSKDENKKSIQSINKNQQQLQDNDDLKFLVIKLKEKDNLIKDLQYDNEKMKCCCNFQFDENSAIELKQNHEKTYSDTSTELYEDISTEHDSFWGDLSKKKFKRMLKESKKKRKRSWINENKSKKIKV